MEEYPIKIEQGLGVLTPCTSHLESGSTWSLKVSQTMAFRVLSSRAEAFLGERSQVVVVVGGAVTDTEIQGICKDQYMSQLFNQELLSRT